jgi:hypothetical protein
METHRTEGLDEMLTLLRKSAQTLRLLPGSTLGRDGYAPAVAATVAATSIRKLRGDARPITRFPNRSTLGDYSLEIFSLHRWRAVADRD